MKLAYLILGLLCGILLSEQLSYAQSNNFFSATISANSRFKSAGGANDCADCPGFNPCNGSTVGGPVCDGPGLLRQTLVDASLNVVQVGLVGPQACISICVGTPSNPTNDTKLEVKVSPFFAMTGPGAVTDNMFNAVADPTRTAAEVTAGSPAFGKGSRDPAKCGNTGAGGSFDPTIDPGVRSGLNCGYLRNDLATQGLTIPSGNNTLSTGQTVVSLTKMILTSSSGTPCVLATDPPRANNTGEGCDLVDFNAPARAFTSNVFPTGSDWTAGPFTGIPNGLHNEFSFSRNVVCRSDTGDTTCTKQSLVQETQTENGISHAEWAFLWSTKNIDPAGTPSGAATCGNPIHGVAQSTGGKICVHWYSDYEDSPCKIVGAYDPNAGPNSCRGVASGYGFLDISEGYFVRNGDAVGTTPTSYPLGPQASFGIINGATSP